RGEGAASLERSLVGDEGHVGNGRGAGVAHLETVGGGLPLHADAELGADRGHVARGVRCLELTQTGERRGHRPGAGPVRTGEEDARRRVAELLAPEAGSDRMSVPERLAVAGEIGADADGLAGTAEVQAETGAHVVQDEHGAQTVRPLAETGEEA